MESGDAAAIEELLLTLDMPIIISLFATVITIIIVILYCRCIEKRKLRTMGFVKKNFLREYLLGLLIGAVLFSAALYSSYMESVSAA